MTRRETPPSKPLVDWKNRLRDWLWDLLPAPADEPVPVPVPVRRPPPPAMGGRRRPRR